MLIMTPLSSVIDVVKLQKQVAYKYKGHKIYKYRINIPANLIEQLKLDAGTELEIRINDDKLEIEKAKRTSIQQK